MQIAFYKGKAHIGNRLISWWTRGVYSHCEVITGIDTVTGEKLCASASGRDGGVRFKLMNLPADKWDIIEVPFDGYEAAQWFEDHKDKAYDYLGLVGFVWSAQHDSKDKWFCSEAVAASMGFAEAWRFDPNHLARVCERMGTWVQKTASK